MLRNSECFISGHVEFESNNANSYGGAISATCSSLILIMNSTCTTEFIKN